MHPVVSTAQVEQDCRIIQVRKDPRRSHKIRSSRRSDLAAQDFI